MIENQNTADRAKWRALKRLHLKSDIGTNEMARLIADGDLQGHDFVKRADWKRWRRAGDVPEIRSLYQQPAHKRSQPGASPLRSRLVHELVSFAGVAIYLWIILLMLKLHEIVVLKQHGLVTQDAHPAIVQALILGKVVLLAEMLRLGRRIGTPSPAIDIVWKAALFAVALLLFEIGEHAALAYWHGTSVYLAVSDADTIGKVSTRIAIMTIALLPYFVYKEAQKQHGSLSLLSLATRKQEARP